MTAMSACYKCWFDLRVEIRKKSKSAATPDPEVGVLQNHLVRVAKQKYIKSKGLKDTPAEHYFDLLHWLLSTIIQPYPLIREIQSSIFTYYDFNFNVPRVAEYRRLERLDVGSRYKLIWLLNRLLKDYPDKYLQFCSPDNLLRRIWLGRWRQNPLWYICVLEAEQGQLFLTDKDISDGRGDFKMNLHKNRSKRRNPIAYYEKQERQLFGKSDDAIKMEKEFVEIDYSDEDNVEWEPLYQDQYNLTAARLYSDEFNQAAAQLHSDGVRTIHIARILNMSRITAWEGIKEHYALGKNI
jgi:hypothetical protein